MSILDLYGDHFSVKLISGWGFNSESWKGQRGEYWVLIQVALMVGYGLLPVHRPAWLAVNPPLLYGVWGVSIGLLFGGLFLVGKGLLDLGGSLTPLPYPREDGQLIQTGIYGWVRHPLYSGIILVAKAYALSQLSLSHVAGTLLLLLFLNVKAGREETWLSQKYTEYAAYQQRVKKLIPWVF